MVRSPNLLFQKLSKIYTARCDSFGITLVCITSNLPPIVVIHGDADPGVPIQQSELFIQRAREAGAKLPKLVVRHGKGHGWGNFWESKEDIQVFMDWFDQYLRNIPESSTRVPAEKSP